MKKYYILENGWDIEIFEDRQEAIEKYKMLFERLTKSEKEKIEYFRLYEIQTDKKLEDIETDLMDYETETIFQFRQYKGRLCGLPFLLL